MVVIAERMFVQLVFILSVLRRALSLGTFPVDVALWRCSCALGHNALFHRISNYIKHVLSNLVAK